MKKLHSYILKAFLGPLLLTLLIVIFVLLMQFLWKYIDDLVGKGLDVWMVVQLLTHTAATLVSLAVPLAVLLAAIMTLGNLGETYELLAIKAAGVSLQKILTPVIILCFFICAGSFVFSDYVMPYSAGKAYSLLFDIRNKKTELILMDGVFTDIDKYSMYIGEKNHETNQLYDIIIYENANARSEKKNMTIADSGFMYTTPDKRFMMVDLYSGYNYEDEAEDKKATNGPRYPFRKTKFSKQTFKIDLSEFSMSRTDENMFRNGYQMMSISKLNETTDSMMLRIDSISNNLRAVINPKLLPDAPYFNNENSLIRAIDSTDYIKDPDIGDFNTFFSKTTPDTRLKTVRQASGIVNNIQYDSWSYLGSEITKQSEYVRKYLNEKHKKYSLSFACLMMFFVGAPLGALIRKGGLGTPLVVSILIFLFYYVISITGEKMARDGSLSPFIGVWFSTFIILPIGLFLTWQATNESAFMNMDTYTNFFRKVKALIFQSIESLRSLKKK